MATQYGGELGRDFMGLFFLGGRVIIDTTKPIVKAVYGKKPSIRAAQGGAL